MTTGLAQLAGTFANDSVRRFRGGSDFLTLLIDGSEGQRVRKVATGGRREKLRAQYDWLLRHQHIAEVPKVYFYTATDQVFVFEMTFEANARAFFDAIHSVPIEQSCAHLRHIMGVVSQEIHKKRLRVQSFPLAKRYFYEKLIAKVDASFSCSVVLQRLSEYERIVVNGKELQSFSSIVSALEKKEQFWKSLAIFDEADIHGDLTIDNMLVDNEKFFLLDPNNENYISDPIVDWAKLFQSLHGGYEFLCRTSSVSVQGNEIVFEAAMSSQYLELFRELQGHLETNVESPQKNLLKFHEAVHFARLLPYKIFQDYELAPLYYSALLLLLNDFYSEF